MAIKNNTNILSGRNIGVSRETEDITRALEIERSRANYQYRVKVSEQKVAMLRQYAYKMIYRWTLEEKRQMIQSYGEYHLVKNPRDEEEINRQLVETLLVNLSEAELNKIVQQVNYTERTFVKTIDNINRGHDADSKKAIQGTMQRGRANISGLATSAGARRAGFKLDKNSFKINSLLEKELKGLFKNYSKGQLATLADELKLEFSDGDAPSKVMQGIINELGMYVAMIMGTSKGMMNISSSTFSVAKKILRYTSFAWTVGERTLSVAERNMVKVKAQKAKAAQRAKSDLFQNLRIRDYLLLRPLRDRVGASKVLRTAKEHPNSEEGKMYNAWKQLTLEELYMKAAEFGVTIKDNWTFDEIFVHMMIKRQGLIRQNQRLAKKIQKALKKGNTSTAKNLMGERTEKNKILRAFGEVTEPKDRHVPGLLAEGGSRGMPIISIDKDGNMLSSFIDAAVPVVIVGNTSAGLHKKSADAKESEAIALSAAQDPVIQAIIAKGSHRTQNGDLDFNQKGSEAKLDLIKQAKIEATKYMGRNDETKKGLRDEFLKYVSKDSDWVKNMTDLDFGLGAQENPYANLNKDSERPAQGSVQKAIIDFSENAVASLNGAISENIGNSFKTQEAILNKLIAVGTTLDQSNGFLTTMQTDVKTVQTDIDTLTHKNHMPYDKIKRYMNIAGKRLKIDEVQPVWITNGYTQYLNETVEDGLSKINKNITTSRDFLKQALPQMMYGLQEGGMVANGAAAAGAIMSALDAVSSSMDRAVADLSAKTTHRRGVKKYATGGSGQASNTPITQFISGDSLTSRANPEMVSVDWDKKQFAVKPMEPTVANDKKLSAVDRMSSFGVSFREATIHYRGSLDGTDDDIALKVYPVISTWNTKVDVNGNSVTPIELMAGMYGSLVNIEGLLGQSVTLTQAIAAKPTQTQPIVQSSQSSGGFTSSLDSILRGD